MASLATLLISLTVSKAKAMVMLLFLLAVLILIRFTLFPLREVPPYSVHPWRDSREFLALYALWVGWLAQSMLAYFVDIHTSGLVEFLRSTGLVIVASMAWNSDQKPKTPDVVLVMERRKQRVLLSVFWFLILPPLTTLGLLQTTPIISVLRVMIVFTAAVASDMKRKTYTRGQTPEEMLELEEQKKTDAEGSADVEFCRFLPLYIVTFGWALFVPPIYWSGFLVLSCISVWHFTKNFMGKGMSGVLDSTIPPLAESPTPASAPIPRRRSEKYPQAYPPSLQSPTSPPPPAHLHPHPHQQTHAGQGRYAERESRKRGRRLRQKGSRAGGGNHGNNSNNANNNFLHHPLSSAMPCAAAQESDDYYYSEEEQEAAYYPPSQQVHPEKSSSFEPNPTHPAYSTQYPAAQRQPVFDSRNTNGFHPYDESQRQRQRQESTAPGRYETAPRKSNKKNKHVTFQESSVPPLQPHQISDVTATSTPLRVSAEETDISSSPLPSSLKSALADAEVRAGDAESTENIKSKNDQQLDQTDSSVTTTNTTTNTSDVSLPPYNIGFDR